MNITDSAVLDPTIGWSMLAVFTVSAPFLAMIVDINITLAATIAAPVILVYLWSREWRREMLW
jgi:hypothetical protein